MPVTKLADVIVPQVFSDYLDEKILEKSALLGSGILYTDEAFTNFANGGGEIIKIPFFNALNLDAEDSGKGYDGEALTPDKISSVSQMAVKIFRAKSFGATDFSAMLSGADPMKAIADKIADFWIRNQQKTLISILKGVFGVVTSHVLDNSANTANATDFIDAIAKLGDAGEEISTIVMHSAVFYKLAKDNLITYGQKVTDGKKIPYFLGKEVITDDAMPNDAGVYTTYLFAKNSIAYATIRPKNAVETDRDTLSGIDYLISRRGFIMHPYAMSFEKPNPTDTDLQTASNWKKVFENDKNIKMAAIKHKIA